MMSKFRVGDFKEDLKVGRLIEDLAIDMIMVNYPVELQNRNDDYKYDFMMNDKTKYEVKFDRKSHTTKNIYIENMAFGKLSGINRTEADYYIIAVPKCLAELNNYNLWNLDFYLIQVSKLKELIRDKKYKYMNASQVNNGYIFDMDIIIQNSQKL